MCAPRHSLTRASGLPIDRVSGGSCAEGVPWWRTLVSGLPLGKSWFTSRRLWIRSEMTRVTTRTGFRPGDARGPGFESQPSLRHGEGPGPPEVGDAARDFASIDSRVRKKLAGYLVVKAEDVEALKVLLHSVKIGHHVQRWDRSEIEFRIEEGLVRRLDEVRFLPLDEEDQNG